MTTEKKPRRRLCRRQNYLQVPIGVSLRQQHLQGAVNTTLRRVKVRMAAIKMEMKRVKYSNQKERAMTTEKKPRRRLCRRQNYLQVPIGVSLRQQHLQRAMNSTLRRVEVRMAAIKMEMKRVKNSNEKERVELREMEARLPQLIAERMHAQKELVWTQACCDAMEALLFAP